MHIFSSQNSAYLLALLSATLFSGASVIFARFAVSHSSQWMNFMKNTLAGSAFVIVATLLVVTGREQMVTHFRPLFFLLLSGFIGLSVGDYFLFRGYQKLGSARTIMVFSFSPIFLAIEGAVFFGQSLALYQFIAIALMVACVWTISFEKFRERGTWEWQGILFACLGVFLDNIGVVLSRKAFDLEPGMGSMFANAIRVVGAVVPFYLFLKWRGEKPFLEFKKLKTNDKGLVVGASLMGTFLSLFCWLTALKIGHIASLAGVGSFNPVAASLWEWALLCKRPTKFLILALSLFLSGFLVLMNGASAF